MNTQSAALKSPKPSFPGSVLLALLLMAGCTGRPLKGGHALTAPQPGGGLAQTLSQGDNPSQPSSQQQETIKVRTYTVPAGSQFEFAPLPASDAPRLPRRLATPKRSEGGSEAEARAMVAEGANAKGQIATGQLPPFLSSALHPPSSRCVLSSPMPVTEREETRATTQLGAAQKDTARELGAKLASLRGIVWVGLGLFLFGLGTLFYAPLRLLIGSLTTSLALTLGGLALMILPTLIVGNELLILAGVAVAIGGWFLAHRHGQLRGQIASLSPSSSAPTPPQT